MDFLCFSLKTVQYLVPMTIDLIMTSQKHIVYNYMTTWSCQLQVWKLHKNNLLDWSNSRTCGNNAGIISLLINLQATVKAKHTSTTFVLRRSWNQQKHHYDMAVCSWLLAASTCKLWPGYMSVWLTQYVPWMKDGWGEGVLGMIPLKGQLGAYIVTCNPVGRTSI